MPEGISTKIGELETEIRRLQQENQSTIRTLQQALQDKLDDDERLRKIILKALHDETREPEQSERAAVEKITLDVLKQDKFGEMVKNVVMNKKLIQHVFETEPDFFSRHVQKAMKEADLGDEKFGKNLHYSIQVHQQKENKEFGNFWFALPANTYGTAVWVLLVVDNKAFSITKLFSCAGFADEPQNMPPHQQWKDEENSCSLICLPYLWFRRRLWPFLNVGLFFVVGIGLCVATFFIQFGFAFLLNQSLELDFNFRSTEGTEYICGTTGWLQFISIGFFLSYMLGQLPQVLKTFLLIWFSDYETTAERGLDKKKALSRDVKDADRSEGRSHERSGLEMSVRRCLATLVFFMDFGVTCFVTCVGVRYIFWSGYKSLDPAYLDPEDPDPDRFGPWPNKSGAFPWMSNTSGIEEVLMATLALIFIVDVDENLFVYMLPACIQTVVQDTRLSCTKWMPNAFHEGLAAYTPAGQTLLTDPTLTLQTADDFANLGQPPSHTKPEMSVTESDKKDRKLEQHKDSWLQVKAIHFRALGVGLQAVGSDKVVCLVQLIPFITFFWIAIIIAVSAGVVWFVRASRECARFSAAEMPDMPSITEEDDGVWLLDNAHSVSAYWLFLPVFVGAGLCVLMAARYLLLVYCADIICGLSDSEAIKDVQSDQNNQEETPTQGVIPSPQNGMRSGSTRLGAGLGSDAAQTEQTAMPPEIQGLVATTQRGEPRQGGEVSGQQASLRGGELVFQRAADARVS